MSYDDALKLLQNTGATVDLILSQIFQQNATNSAEQVAYKRKEDGRVSRHNREPPDATWKERTALVHSYQNANQCQIKPKMKQSEDMMNRSECMATVKSMPDLPKVGLSDGQFNHSHSTLHTPPS